MLLDPLISVNAKLIKVIFEACLSFQEFLDPLLKLLLFNLNISEFDNRLRAEALILVFEPLAFGRELSLHGLMRLKHLFDLVFVFVLNHFDQSIPVVLILVLCAVASLLQLLQGDLEFPLRLDQILFVVLFLVLQELALTLPESLVLVIRRLKVRELSLQILHGSFELHDGLCLCVAIVVSLSSARVKILNLSLVLLNLLLVLSLLLPPILIKSGIILLQQA